MKFFINSALLHIILIILIASHDILFSFEKSVSNTSKSIKKESISKNQDVYNEALHSIAITEEELQYEVEQIEKQKNVEKDILKNEAFKQIEQEKQNILKKISYDKILIENKEKELKEKEIKLKEEEQKILETKDLINQQENKLLEEKISVQHSKNNAEELLNYIEYEKNKVNQKFNEQTKEIESKNRALIEKNQILLKREQEINDLKNKLNNLIVTNKKKDSFSKKDSIQDETLEHIENIKHKILNNWQYIPEYKGVSCKITLNQDNKGYILKVQFNECYNDIDFQNSIRKAIFASNPLPLPKNKEIFQNNISLFFKIH